jgi:tetratricopeptide (TPR) repeat protein
VNRRTPPVEDAALGRWLGLGLVALIACVAIVPLSLLRTPHQDRSDPLQEAATFTGTASCGECHRDELERWQGSDHDLAMDVASDATVLGDFDDVAFTDHGVTSRFYRRDGRFYVWTEGPDGAMAEFEIAYTFGHDPLQQYLIPFPGGRLQALNIAWDVPRQRWFRLYPDADIPPGDWLHWTRNGQNWNGMCAECHSTNLRKNYDPATQTYATTWSDIDVGCEACHGPGSRHVAWAEIPPMGRPDLANAGLVVPTSGISSTQLVELCAPCHSRRAELADYDHTGTELLDTMLPSLLREGLYHPDGQILDEVYVYGSFVQSKMYARGIRCSDCHDSHSLRLRFEGNELCLQCHQREVYDTYEHHFHQKEVDGKPSDGALCVKCHMVERPYMVIDWRADHSLRIPRPDLSAEIGTPNACTQPGCHDDKPLQWSLDAYRKWYGQARHPHFGTTFAAARAGAPGVEDGLRRLVESPLHPAIVRATALELLSQRPGAVDAALRERSLLSAEPLLRQTAASTLAEPDPERRAELLAPLLSDPIRAVRLAAGSQLAGTPDADLRPYQRVALSQTITEYEASMRRTLDFPSSGLNLGNLYMRLGRTDEAERSYRLALEIDDRFLPARMNLSVLLNAQGRNEEAERLLREAVRQYPDQASPAYSLGLLLAETGKPEEAVTWLRRAARADAQGTRVWYNLGLLLQQLGRLDEAELALTTALNRDPTNLDCLHALADHYVRRGRLDEASALADRMIASHPEQAIGRNFKSAVEQLRARPGSRR